MRILIPDRLKPPADIEQAVFGDAAEILLPVAGHESDVPDEYWRTADAILAWHEVSLGADVIDKLDRCRVIVRIGVGYDNVDLQAAGARGIVVCNVPDFGTNDVADHTIGLLLGLRRGLFAYDTAARRGSWSWPAAGTLHRLTGQTLGLIGIGRIGTAVAMRARGLGMCPVFYDPYKDAGYDKALGIERVRDLDDLLGRSDVVSFHTPLTDATRNMAGAGFFEQLKPGAVVLNTARGPIVDLDALEAALRSGRVSGAGLDVLPQEPPDVTHPLIRAWIEQDAWIIGRLIITPHASFYNEESYNEMRTKAAQEALRVIQGEPPRSCVNERWLRPVDATAPL